MNRKAYTTPTLKTYACTSARIIAASPLTGSTEGLSTNSSFETPIVDNGGLDMPW